MIFIVVNLLYRGRKFDRVLDGKPDKIEKNFFNKILIFFGPLKILLVTFFKILKNEENLLHTADKIFPEGR